MLNIRCFTTQTSRVSQTFVKFFFGKGVSARHLLPGQKSNTCRADIRCPSARASFVGATIRQLHSVHALSS